MPKRLIDIIREVKVDAPTIRDFLLRRMGIYLDVRNLNVFVKDDIYDILIRKFRPEFIPQYKSRRQTRTKQQTKSKQQSRRQTKTRTQPKENRPNLPFHTIDEMRGSSDDVIIDFFNNAVFDGEFSSEVKSKKNPERYCGHIGNIKLEGRRLYFIPNFFNIPQSVALEPGCYKFRLEADVNELKAEHDFFIHFLYESLWELNKMPKPATMPNLDPAQIAEQDEFALPDEKPNLLDHSEENIVRNEVSDEIQNNEILGPKEAVSEESTNNPIEQTNQPNKLNKMASLNDFVVQKPRQLPVIVAVDRSGSMRKDGKIEALNLAIKNFINSLKEEKSDKIEIQVALYSFGGNDEVTCENELSPVSSIECKEYIANGRTPLGETIRIIKQLIEDRTKIPSRSYAPTVVILTDGIATDKEKTVEALPLFVNEGRSAKAFRIAMAIGDDADFDFLKQFVSEPDYLVTGESAADIKQFFKFVTMSVSQRTHSLTPDSVKLSFQNIQPDDELVI